MSNTPQQPIKPATNSAESAQRRTPTHKFTVILVRPDWCADSYGTDTMVCYVEVQKQDADLASQQAKRELWELDNTGPEGMSKEPQGDPSDYFCAAVFGGWQNNQYAG